MAAPGGWCLHHQVPTFIKDDIGEALKEVGKALGVEVPATTTKLKVEEPGEIRFEEGTPEWVASNLVREMWAEGYAVTQSGNCISVQSVPLTGRKVFTLREPVETTTVTVLGPGPLPRFSELDKWIDYAWSALDFGPIKQQYVRRDEDGGKMFARGVLKLSDWGLVELGPLEHRLTLDGMLLKGLQNESR